MICITLILSIVISLIKFICESHRYSYKKETGEKLIVKVDNLWKETNSPNETTIILVDRDYLIRDSKKSEIDKNSLQRQFVEKIVGMKYTPTKIYEKYDIYEIRGKRYLLFKDLDLTEESERSFTNGYLGYSELVHSLFNIIDEDYRKDRSYRMPVIGSRLTFKNNRLNHQNRLQFLVTLFKIHRFNQQIELTICINKTSFKNYNLRDL